MLIYETCSAVEVELEWEEDLWTLHADANQAKARLDDRLSLIIEKVLRRLNYEGHYEIVMCLSDTENFRKKILPSYKANRADKRKPVCYAAVVEWVKANYDTRQYPTLEADDCVGIMMTRKGAHAVSVSGDKDFMSIPGKFFNHLTDVLKTISEEEANYRHLYQTLVGDTADNYKGCPSYGDVTARKLLDKTPTWQAVKEAFESKGLTAEDALVQARVARILRASDWDFKKKCPKLWTPRKE